MDVFLETDRLILRRFTAADLDNLVELDSDPDVMRYITGGRPTPREQVRDEVLPAFLAYYEGIAGADPQGLHRARRAARVRRDDEPRPTVHGWSRDGLDTPVGGSAARSLGVLGVGKEDPERGTSAGAFLDPGSAAVEAGELGDQGEADAGAGGVVGDVAALVEGLEDLLAELGRYSRSVVFNQQQDTVVPGMEPDPDGRPRWGVLGRIDDQVLDDPFQLGSISGQAQRRGIDHHRVLVVDTGLVDHPVRQGAEVDQLAARGEGAAGEPVQVQQVAEEPIKLAGVG
jgi:hypothetical protein